MTHTLAIVLIAIVHVCIATRPIDLYASDFEHGTVVINTTGAYRLAEDISFKPNPVTADQDAWSSGFLHASQRASNGGPYDDAAFGLGFFAALVIAADDVTLDLKGHRIEQSAEHALLQRFFAVIELNDRPFIPGQGPHNFGNAIKAAKNVVIHNGIIGRSAHHGIHGNANEDIEIRDVVFEDYEVAAVALNGVQGLVVRDCVAVNRKDLPVLGTFSSARFIQPYLDFLDESASTTTLRIQGVPRDIAHIKSTLRSAVNNVHADISSQGKIDAVAHPDEYAVFHNRHGIIDGNSYAFLTNKIGVAVLGFPEQPMSPMEFAPARNVRFEYVQVWQHRAVINEIVALKRGGPVIDPVGSVFQVKNKHPDTGMPVTINAFGEYTGNPIANAQAFVAKAALNGDFAASSLDISRLSIDQAVIDWIEANPGTNSASLSNLTAAEGFLCNGDSMFHVNKGVVSFKIDATQNAVLKNIMIDVVENIGNMGSLDCGHYQFSHPAATLEGYGGAHVRAFSFAGSSHVQMKNVHINRLSSSYGNSIGVDAFTDSSNLEFKNINIDELSSARISAGFHFGPEVDVVQLKNYCVTNVHSTNATFIVYDENSAHIEGANCH